MHVCYSQLGHYTLDPFNGCIMHQMTTIGTNKRWSNHIILHNSLLLQTLSFILSIQYNANDKNFPKKFPNIVCIIYMCTFYGDTETAHVHLKLLVVQTLSDQHLQCCRNNTFQHPLGQDPTKRLIDNIFNGLIHTYGANVINR